MDEEFKKSLSAPAIFANRFYVARVDGGISRLAFGETLNSETNFHTALRMTDADFIALRDLLLKHFPPAGKQN